MTKPVSIYSMRLGDSNELGLDTVELIAIKSVLSGSCMFKCRSGRGIASDGQDLFSRRITSYLDAGAPTPEELHRSVLYSVSNASGSELSRCQMRPLQELEYLIT